MDRRRRRTRAAGVDQRRLPNSNAARRMAAFAAAARPFPTGNGVMLVGDHDSQQATKMQALAVAMATQEGHFAIVTHTEPPKNGRPGHAKLYRKPRGTQEPRSRRVVRVTGHELARIVKRMPVWQQAVGADPGLQAVVYGCEAGVGNDDSVGDDVAEGLGAPAAAWPFFVAPQMLGDMVLSKDARVDASDPVIELGTLDRARRFPPTRDRNRLNKTASYSRESHPALARQLRARRASK